jgi:hypothetical protein
MRRSSTKTDHYVGLKCPNDRETKSVELCKRQHIDKYLTMLHRAVPPQPHLGTVLSDYYLNRLVFGFVWPFRSGHALDCGGCSAEKSP